MADDPLPPELNVVTTPTGVLYDLPPRQVGCLRYFGLAVIFFGLVVSGIGLSVTLIEAGVLDWLRGGPPPDYFKAAFGVPFFVAGLFPMYLGSFLLGGRGSIELDGETLVATSRFGVLWKRRMIKITDIRKLQIKTGNTEEGPEVLCKMMGALNAVMNDGTLKCLTWGYPKAFLRALATDLSVECENRKGSRLVGEPEQTIGIEERTLQGNTRQKDDKDTPLEVSPRPADAVGILEHHEDGVTITIPPVGIRKGGKGLFGFSIMWNLFMIVFTSIWAFGGGFKVGWDLLGLLAFFSLFWAIGIGMGITALNAGKRKAILDVVGETLLITRQNIFKTRQQEVARDNIQSIRRDKSGVEVNEVPVLNLQIRLHQGKKISLLSQLDDDELSWIASELRQALRLDR